MCSYCGSVSQHVFSRDINVHAAKHETDWPLNIIRIWKESEWNGFSKFRFSVFYYFLVQPPYKLYSYWIIFCHNLCLLPTLGTNVESNVPFMHWDRQKQCVHTLLSLTSRYIIQLWMSSYVLTYWHTTTNVSPHCFSYSSPSSSLKLYCQVFGCCCLRQSVFLHLVLSCSRVD